MSLILDGTNGLSDVDGTAATPAIRGTDTNTGIFFPAADTIAFSEGGVESMRIDSAGNVGIGTSSPEYKLHVASGTAGVTGTNGRLLISNGNTSGGMKIGTFTSAGSANGYLAFEGNDREYMRIDGSGNVMIGTTSNNNRQFFVSGGTTGNYLAQLNNTTANPIGVWVGYTAASPNGTVNNFFYCEDSTTVRVRFASNGGLYNYSANNSNLSDKRDKKDIELAGNYLDKICAIPVKTFLFNDQTDTDLNLGVIAQDVQAVAPELISETNWGTEEEPKMRLSIYQTDLQYALMKSIQELKSIVDAQAARITALEGTAV